MKKCIIIPSSFKGSMTSMQVCDIMKLEVLTHFPNCKVMALPISDGGEGTVDAFLYAVNSVGKTFVDTTGPYGEKVKTYYAKIKNRAVMEIASVAGLKQAQGKLDPLLATTYGMGNLIKHAIGNGCNEIIIGLGNSCTNDGGIGLACSLGTIFYDKYEEPFIPTIATIDQIDKIDSKRTLELLKDIKITGLCDVKTPLCGLNGTSYINGPLKGGIASTIKTLDTNLTHLAEMMKKNLGVDIASMPGGGSAGGLGAGIVGFMNGTLRASIDTVLDFIQFDQLLKGTDMVFTGEGKIEGQLDGKVVYGIGRRAKEQNIPVIAVCGIVGNIKEDIYDHGITAIFSTTRQFGDFEIIKRTSVINLKRTMSDILRLYKVGGKDEDLR